MLTVHVCVCVYVWCVMIDGGEAMVHCAADEPHQDEWRQCYARPTHGCASSVHGKTVA